MADIDNIHMHATIFIGKYGPTRHTRTYCQEMLPSMDTLYLLFILLGNVKQLQVQCGKCSRGKKSVVVNSLDRRMNA